MTYGINIDREEALSEGIPGCEFPPDSELLTEIPDHLVRLICHSQGARSPKYPKYAAFSNAYSSNSDTCGALYKTKRERKNHPATPWVGGNLAQNDYRFWRGWRNETAVSAFCRWCTFQAYDKPQRDTHFGAKENICTKALRTVYDYTRGINPKYCFICGKKTPATRWGFPICDDNSCRESWQFDDMANHDVFREAVKICIVRGLMGAYMETADECFIPIGLTV